jgi:eukaryotic-like serine/threonine-protein kinase
MIDSRSGHGATDLCEAHPMTTSPSLLNPLDGATALAPADWLPHEFRGTPGQFITSTITGNSYFIGRQIGEGAFGIVFHCTDMWDNNLVIKVLKPSLAHEVLTTQDRAVHELVVLAHVRHPNIVHVHEAFEFQGTYCIVSDQCSQTLAEFMHVPNFAPRTWIRGLSRCILQALHFTHVQHLAHCDVHSGNVFVHYAPDEIVPERYSSMIFKLGDFGLARPLDSLTSRSTFLNRIRPPEAVDVTEFGPLDHRVDIYQCGLLLLEFLLGETGCFSQDDLLAGRPQEVALMHQTPLFESIACMVRRHVPYRTPNALTAWEDIRSALLVQ